jgi:SanA protein
MKIISFILKKASFIVLSVVIIILAINWFVLDTANQYVLRTSNEIPEVDTALVLGTSSYTIYGSPNKFFEFRVDAAAELYERGVVKRIIASGYIDEGYNEPEQMKEALIERGVPENAIDLDGGGYDTLASVERMESVWRVDRYVVVTQEFHVKRAVYIARRLGAQAYGFNADDVSSNNSVRTRVREVFARVKAFGEVELQRVLRIF